MKSTLKGLLLALFILFAGNNKSFSQSSEIPKDAYLASAIPDSLRKHASSIVRYAEIIIDIKTPDKAIIKLHTVITLLNDKAAGLAGMALGYNKKFDTYNGIEMNVYNDKGEPIKKYRKGDMYDGSAANGMTLVTDERFLGLKHTVAAYPVTIEKEYEEDKNSFIDLGQWYLQLVGQSIQHSVIKVIANPSVGFRYKMLNTEFKPAKSSINGSEEYTWEFNGISALRNTANALPWKVLPDIEMAVNNFSCYGYPGDFSSWQSFGIWFGNLNSDVCTLSPQRIAEIRKMTDTINTQQGKARFLYHYLQQNVRYVDIDLGIGGYKSFPAAFVDEKKYGDCKALSNYMRALLKAVNIDADYVLIGAGDKMQSVDPSFPCNRFNHVILCVPFKNDTTWLECTSQTEPYGKLVASTEDRKALVIEKDGGKLVEMPGSHVSDNRFDSEINIQLNADGSAKTSIKIATIGEYRLHYLAFNGLSLDQQKQLYTRMLHMRQFSKLDLTYKDDNGVDQIDMDAQFDKFCDIVSADKLFFKPSAIDLSMYNLPVEAKRKTDFQFEFPMSKSCITTISLPSGYVVETLPQNASLKFAFGSYVVNYTYDQAKNEVISIAKFNITSAVVPSESYTEMQQFFDRVNGEEQRKLVVRKKE